jgi:hypothetical protein
MHHELLVLEEIWTLTNRIRDSVGAALRQAARIERSLILLV